jgi:universal stress protein E
MQRFQNILVAVDSRWDEHPALEWAVRLARHNHAKLKIVDVLTDLSWISKLVVTDNENIQEALTEQKRRMLEDVAQPIRAQGVEVTTRLLFGKTAFAIMHEVLRSAHDLVVRVTKGAHSGRTGFFGTNSMRLLRQCPCAVWLVRADTPLRFARVLAVVDPAPHDFAQEIMNKTIMDLGQSIADYEDGQFHMIHVCELSGASADESWLHPGKLEETVRKAKMEGAAALDKFMAPYNLSHSHHYNS